MTSQTLVLHIVGSLEYGGGQKLTALVATGLDPAKFAVTVLNLGPTGPYSRYLTERGVHVIELGLPQSPGVWDTGKLVSGYLRLLQVLFARPRWDIVHTHMFLTSLLSAVPARVAGSRVFGTVHRNYYAWQPIVERLLAPLHEAIVVDSAAAGRILQARTKIPEDRYVVIHNGIDPGEFASMPEQRAARSILDVPANAVVVAEIAALVPHKGQANLVKAFAGVAPGRPDVYLLLVGSGPDESALRDLVTSLGLAERVRLIGERGDLPVVLSATDIVALPSTFEGFGIVLAEAMFAGLPTLSTDRGGAVEVVVDGMTGFLVPFGDVAALARRLDQLVSDPELRRQMGDAGRQRVTDKFLQRHMAEAYQRLYGREVTRGLEAAHDA